MIASQLSGICDVISNRLGRHQQNDNRASETWGWCIKIVVFIVIYGLYHVRNVMMYVRSWWTVSALTRVLFWYLSPSLLHNSGNKHQNNPFVSTETVCHSNTYIILYIFTETILPIELISWTCGYFVCQQAHLSLLENCHLLSYDKNIRQNIITNCQPKQTNHRLQYRP